MVFILFGIPLIIFFLFLFHHHKRPLPSDSFVLGLLSFFILNLTTFFFVSECHALFLNIVKPDWFYYEEQPETPFEAVVISLKILIFYELPEYRILDEFDTAFLLYLVFWFLFYFITASLAVYLTKRTNWITWNNHKTNDVIFLPERARFIEHKLFWFVLAIIYFFLAFGFDEPIVPPMLYLLPILPTLSISVLILRGFFQEFEFTRRLKLTFLVLAVCPILSFNVFPGICQAITLTGYTILLQKLVQVHS